MNATPTNSAPQANAASDVESWWLETPTLTDLADGTARLAIKNKRGAQNYTLGVIWDDKTFDILGWCVTRADNGAYYCLPATLDCCECGAWQFRNPTQIQCKHIRTCRKLLAEIGMFGPTEGE